MNADLQAKAKKLYFQTDLSKTEIANALGIPRRTLHHWIKEHNWEYQKQCNAHMPVLIAENCYHIMANYSQQLLAPDRKDVVISLKEVDALHRLIAVIGKLKGRTTLNENMEIFTTFTGAVHDRSPEMARAIAPYISDFIASGASASVAVPVHSHVPLTAEELETEARLDHQYTLEDEPLYTSPTPPVQRPPMSLPGERQAEARRRRTYPSYAHLLADLRSQDENIKHLFPVHTHYTRTAA